MTTDSAEQDGQDVTESEAGTETSCEQADELFSFFDDADAAENATEEELLEYQQLAEAFYDEPNPPEIADDLAVLSGRAPLPDDELERTEALMAASGRVSTYLEEICGLEEPDF